MAVIDKSTLAFLKELRKNNNRDWFKYNKPTYEAARYNVEQFLDDLIARISKFDPSIAHHTGKSVMFRIYRDIRFSKDKSLYKTHFGAHISGAEKKSDIHSKAGYYIHIGAGESMIAGGAYMPTGPWIKNIRAAIDTNPSELKKIINKKSFIPNAWNSRPSELSARRDFGDCRLSVDGRILKCAVVVTKGRYRHTLGHTDGNPYDTGK